VRKVSAAFSPRRLAFAPTEVVGLFDLSTQTVRLRMMVGAYDTGMDLLVEAADGLDMAASACDAVEDAALFSSLADRIRRYLAVSRPSTTLGMPRIPSGENRLKDESVIHRSGASQPSHIRVIADSVEAD
jgi:hypothetical protein